jgi:hypothetical protein
MLSGTPSAGVTVFAAPGCRRSMPPCVPTQTFCSESSKTASTLLCGIDCGADIFTRRSFSKRIKPRPYVPIHMWPLRLSHNTAMFASLITFGVANGSPRTPASSRRSPEIVPIHTTPSRSSRIVRMLLSARLSLDR